MRSPPYPHCKPEGAAEAAGSSREWGRETHSSRGAELWCHANPDASSHDVVHVAAAEIMHACCCWTYVALLLLCSQLQLWLQLQLPELHHSAAHDEL